MLSIYLDIENRKGKCLVIACQSYVHVCQHALGLDLLLRCCDGASHTRAHQRRVGGSSAMRTPMYCCHSDVIICAYRVGGGSEIREFVRT